MEQRQLGYVPQGYALFPHLTVRQNIAFALGSAARAGDRRIQAQRTAAVLGELALEALADRYPATLSGGERQRVALARALSVRPRALLLDEPLAALDVSARREVRVFLASVLARLGLPCLIVTHDPDDAQALAHQILVLEAGRVVQSGTWESLRAAPASRFVAELTSR